MRLFFGGSGDGIRCFWVKFWDKIGDAALVACAATAIDCCSLIVGGGLTSSGALQWRS